MSRRLDAQIGRDTAIRQIRQLGYVGDTNGGGVHDVPGFAREPDTLEVSPGTESYTPITDNPFLPVAQNPLSTFSIDVDTASYSNLRRYLMQGQLPPRDSVRIEEMLNYFSYNDPAPTGDTPFSANIEIAACPWAPQHRLVRIGLKGRVIEQHQRPGTNLVFLIDVSGSMQPANKLPLLKQAMKLLVAQLDERDRVALVVYAGNSGLVLPSTPCSNQQTIVQAIDHLEAGGSTNGAAGIQLAYQVATENMIPQGVNRVILATDGDFNVGVTSTAELTGLIEEKARSGSVFLSVLGFGIGNLKDATLEMLADKGNGNYAYIDTLNEARKVLVEQLTGTLITIAKDVKIQVEFNPAVVGHYRLIGYENRLLRAEDFNNDKKDAGEIGAGHSVTALYELVPAGQPLSHAQIDPLKYQPRNSNRDGEGAARPTGSAGENATGAAVRRETLTLKLRYKESDADTSKLLEFPVVDAGESFDLSSRDFQFASAVAAFGMHLRASPHKGDWTLDAVAETAQSATGEDPYGYRHEFVELVRRAAQIDR